ncbi:MAG: hypothetical protein QM817_00885 [Archangium sp.]
MEQNELSIAAFDAAIQDELMVHGDPRGELMALQERQARGENSADIERRVRVLIRKHTRELLGPLAKVLTQVEYERGEPVHASLQTRPQTLFETLDDRRWQTLRGLDVAACNWTGLIGERKHRTTPPRMGELINHCRSLTDVRGLAARSMPERPCERVVHAEVHEVTLDKVFETFPSLRALTWRSVHELPWVHPRVAQLESLTLGGRYQQSVEWRAGVVTLHGEPSGYDLAFLATCPSLVRLEVPEDLLGYAHDMRHLSECFRVAREHGAPVVLVPHVYGRVGTVWY